MEEREIRRSKVEGRKKAETRGPNTETTDYTDGNGLRQGRGERPWPRNPSLPSDFGLRQSQRDCVLQPRVAESARLPWVGVRAIFNPNGVVSPLRQRATTPLGLADTTRFSQGSSRLATLGLGAESLWDSALLTPQGMGSIPGEAPQDLAK